MINIDSENRYFQVLVFLSIVQLIYQLVFNQLTVIQLNYAISNRSIQGSDYLIDIDLKQHFVPVQPDNYMVNPQINLLLPSKIFPKERDTISFEYELVTINTKTQQLSQTDCIIIVKLLDLIY